MVRSCHGVFSDYPQTGARGLEIFLQLANRYNRGPTGDSRSTRTLPCLVSGLEKRSCRCWLACRVRKACEAWSADTGSMTGIRAVIVTSNVTVAGDLTRYVPGGDIRGGEFAGPVETK